MIGGGRRGRRRRSRRFGDKRRSASHDDDDDDDNQRWSSAARVNWKTRRWEDQSAGLVRTTSTIATRSFSFCQRRVWAWYQRSLFFFLLSFSFVRERSTERKDLFLAWSLPYLTRLIYASLLLYNSLSTRVSSFNQIGPSAFLGGRFLTTEIECLRCRTFEPYTVYNLQSFVSKNRIRIHTYIFVYLYLRSIACL